MFIKWQLVVLGVVFTQGLEASENGCPNSPRSLNSPRLSCSGEARKEPIAVEALKRSFEKKVSSGQLNREEKQAIATIFYESGHGGKTWYGDEGRFYNGGYGSIYRYSSDFPH